MATSFVAVDVETANADWSSICQIGAVRMDDGVVTGTLKSLVDPSTYFDPWNVSIHGICKEMVRGAPRYPEIAERLSQFVGGCVVASHTSFDRVALGRVHEKYGLPCPTWSWLDTARVSRRAWADRFAASGYSLERVAASCGIEFRHHDALEDARATGLILVRAMQDAGFDLEGWQRRVRQPIAEAKIGRAGNPEGPLTGEEIVFTGALVMQRAQAAAIAAELGCDVGENVTKRTTMLVVGVQDLWKLNGYEKSGKHRRAEKLIADGASIAILTEDDFLALIKLHQEPAPA